MKTNGNGWSGNKRCSHDGCRKAAWIAGYCASHLAEKHASAKEEK